MNLFPFVVLEGGSKQDKSYAIVAVFILIVILFAVIFSNTLYNSAIINYSTLEKYGWREDIKERDSDSQILNSWCSYTYKNNNISYPSYITITTIKSLFMLSEYELINKIKETINEQTNKQNIQINQPSKIQNRYIKNNHNTVFVTYEGIDNSSSFSEKIKIIGEAWNCGNSGTSIICIGLSQITDEKNNNPTNLDFWDQIKQTNGLLYNVECH